MLKAAFSLLIGQILLPGAMTIAQETIRPDPVSRAKTPESPAHEAARHFMRGANLGNYLEAPKGTSWGASYTVSDFENMKREGFDHVRLPIRWNDYAGPGPEFKLSTEIFAKADFLVTNALRQKLAVIVNIHHFDEFTDAPDAHTNKLTSLWRQIAAHYATAPKSLAFELLNEPKDAATTIVINPIYASVIGEIRKRSEERRVGKECCR